MDDLWRQDAATDDYYNYSTSTVTHPAQQLAAVHYMTQYINQGVEEPIYYSLFY